MLTTDQQVVLVRQYRHGIQQAVWELPSGVVEATDTSPLAAVQRELLEETGHVGEAVVETGRLSPTLATHTNLTYFCCWSELSWAWRSTASGGLGHDAG